MSYKKLFLLTLKSFTFIFFLFCFFIPAKIFTVDTLYFYHFGFAYLKEVGLSLLIIGFLIFVVVIISILKSRKNANLLNFIACIFMSATAIYFLIDGVFNVENYALSTSVLGIAPILMILISMWSFYLFFKDDKVFDFFSIKMKTNNLIRETCILFLSIFILLSFWIPIATYHNPDDTPKRAIFVLDNIGLINFVLLLVYFIILIGPLRKFRDSKVLKIITPVLLVATCFTFIYVSIITHHTWFIGGVVFNMASPYILILTIVSFFVYSANGWLLDSNIKRMFPFEEYS